MRFRRVLLCVPEQASDDVLSFVRDLKTALAVRYHVRLQYADKPIDDDVTPADTPRSKPLVIKIEEPSDDGESAT